MVNRPLIVNRDRLVEFFISLFLVLVVSVSFSVYAATRIVKAEREAQQKQSIAAMTPVCQWLYTADDVFEETKPTTAAGVKQAESIKRLIISFQCEKIVPRS